MEFVRCVSVSDMVMTRDCLIVQGDVRVVIVFRDDDLKVECTNRYSRRGSGESKYHSAALSRPLRVFARFLRPFDSL